MRLVNQRGRITECRAYGDWTTDFLLPWKPWLHPLGIWPMQQFHCPQGKSASCAALVMDVMERLHRGRVDGICIASCNSDFAGLAGRVRERGLLVHGFGQHGASPAFVAACDEFVCLDSSISGSSPELLVRQGLPSAQPPAP